MTRREFLKQLGRLLLVAVMAYVGKAGKIFERNLISPRGKTAKFFRQADDLAG